MVTVLSAVWTGPAGTNPLDPVAVLTTAASGGDASELFDRALLTAWLNLAAGALDPAALVDLDGDGVGDTAVFDLLATAEQARLDPTTSRGDLLALKDELEALSTS
jgi:hypothetical protein